MCDNRESSWPDAMDIDSLPDEPSILQHLPRRDSLRVERVNHRWRRLALTHGWAHVRHFDSRDYAVLPKHAWELEEAEQLKVAHLLDRCGDYVESLHLDCVGE